MEPETKIVLETPTGLVAVYVKWENHTVASINLENVPAFLYRKDLHIDLAGYGDVSVDIGYGGNFFVLADVHSLGLTITKDTVNLLQPQQGHPRRRQQGHQGGPSDEPGDQLP